MSFNISSDVFDNLGVWGLDGEPLVIPCDRVLSKVRIFINSENKEFLNIQAVELITSQGDNLIECDSLYEANLSSNYFFDIDGTNIVNERLIERKLLHSNYEEMPSLSIRFFKDEHIKFIKIFNRADNCGLRSRFISVEGLHEGKEQFLFNNVQDSRSQRLMDELNSLLSDYEKKIQLPKNNVYAAKYIRGILYDIIQGGREVSDELSEALLPVAGRMPRLDKFTARFIARSIKKKLHNKTHINTRELKRFSSILCDDVALDALQKFASKEDNSALNLVIAKHRIHYDTLLEKKEAHLDFLDSLFKSLQMTSGAPLIAYGTLLGAYRDGGFLPADDDLDTILYYPFVVEEEAKEKTKQELLDFLRLQGFSANLQSGCPHITVNSPNASVGVDIFLAWDTSNQSKVSVVMEKLLYREVDKDTLFPAKEISLYGRMYPCPGNIEGFLADRYGKSWSRSNPYHEWPWTLERRKYFNDQILAKGYDHREENRKFRVKHTRTQLIAWSQCVLKTDRPPSNSIPMLKQGIKYDYDVVELDVRATKDGAIVLAHDDVIKNKMGDSIKLSESTLQQAKSFLLGVYNDEDIFLPSLADVLPSLTGKQVLLDARFQPFEYEILRKSVDAIGFDPSMLMFCVYNEKQLSSLILHFPESLHFWKFYTQAWEIDELELYQVRLYGVDGIMFMYPHCDEDITQSIYHIKRFDLQSLCFIHGQNWIPQNSTGLTPDSTSRSKDDYNTSLKNMVSIGIEYVTTTECRSSVFLELIG